MSFRIPNDDFQNFEMNLISCPESNWKYPPEPEIELIADNICFCCWTRKQFGDNEIQHWWQIIFTRKFQESQPSTNGLLSSIS